MVKRFFLSLFLFLFFFSVTSNAEEQRQPEKLQELFIRLLLSDHFEQGKEPPLSLTQKIEILANSPLWRNKIFAEDPSYVSLSRGVNSNWVETATQLTERFLINNMFSLLSGEKTVWPQDPTERKQFFQKKLGMVLSDEEIKRLELFSQSLSLSEKDFLKGIRTSLDVWKINLLWVSRKTSWVQKSYASFLDIESLKGEMTVLEWGEALPASPQEHISHRLGFERTFSLVKHADGSLTIIYTPVDRSMIAYQEPEYVEIQEVDIRTQLRSYRDRTLGPYIATFDPKVAARSRYITLRFLNRHNDLIDRLSVTIDLETGYMITFEGAKSGNIYLAHQIIRLQLLNSASPLAKYIVEMRPEFKNAFHFWEEAPFVEKELALLEDGSFRLALQRMKEGKWIEGTATEFIFDREKTAEILKGPLRNLLREFRP